MNRKTVALFIALALGLPTFVCAAASITPGKGVGPQETDGAW